MPAEAVLAPGLAPGLAPVLAPVLDPALVDRVRRRLAEHGTAPGRASPARVADALRAEGRVLGDEALHDLVGRLRAELVGLGPLQPLLDDPDVTDVLVNGTSGVYVDRGGGLEPVPVRLRDPAAVRRLAQRLAAAAGRRLDDAVPFVDARLPDGVRLHAVLPPVAPDGPLVALRVARRRSFTLAELVAGGSLAAATADLLAGLVAARAALLVSGGTGTGKTTLLGCLLGLVPPTERLVLVEDSGELRPDHPHVVRLEARPANVEGAGAVGLRELVRQALRMRPDRLVVGEVRGAEVVDLLAALNTGHEGGSGTVHANAAEDVPARIESLALAAGLGRGAAHAQLAAGVEAVVHVVRDRGGRRRVAAVGIPVRGLDGLVRVEPAWDVPSRGEPERGAAWPRLRSLLARG